MSAATLYRRIGHDVSLQVATALVLTSALGLALVTHRAVGIALFALLAVGTAAAIAPGILLRMLLLLGGIPFAFVTQGERSLFRSLGGVHVGGLILASLVPLLILVTLPRIVLLRDRCGVGWREVRFYVLFLALAAGSLLLTPDRAGGIRLLFKVAYPLLFLFLTVLVLRTGATAEKLFHWMFAGGLLVVLLSTWNFLNQGMLSSLAAGVPVRHTSGFSHPSPFSLYMLCLFSAAYVRWRIRRGRADLVLSIVFALQVVSALTRISIAAAFAVVLVTELSCSRGNRGRIARTLAIGTAALLVAFAAINVELLRPRLFHGYVGEDAGVMEMLGSINDQGRGTLWSFAFDYYMQGNLVVGNGLGASSLYLGRNVPGVEGATVVHNDWLRILCDLGLLGIGLFVAALLAILRRLRDGRSLASRPHAVLATASLVGLMVVAITDNPLDYYMMYGQYIFFFVGIALTTPQEEAPA